MILGPISYLDCLVFLVLLAPQLLLNAGFKATASCALEALPYLVLQLPYEVLYERLILEKRHRSPFFRHASLFQAVVIRCVKYAFANIPAQIGSIFFSKAVSLPFMRFRMIRHGSFRCPLYWSKITDFGCAGVWVVTDQNTSPDIIVYYLHGGGFSMGSSYFYLEFLMALCSLLKDEAEFRNPAIFALDYTLVPEAAFPVQLKEALAGYKFVLSKMAQGDKCRICVAGDSAGGTIALSLLLATSQSIEPEGQKPDLAIMISPWCKLRSELNVDTDSDYLNADSLHMYADQYMSHRFDYANSNEPKQRYHKLDGHHRNWYASPSECNSVETWVDSSPKQGYYFIYGAEEVLAPEIRILVDKLRRYGIEVAEKEESNAIHAWPVVKLFLEDEETERFRGLRDIVAFIEQKLVQGR